MHIVHVLTRLLRAGSEENTLLTAAGQIKEGHKVTILSGADSKTALAEKLVPEAQCVTIPSLVHPVSPVKDLIAIWQTRNALKKLAPDVVHTHQSKGGIIGRFGATLARIPTIIHGVHILPFVGAVGKSRKFFLWAEKIASKVTHGFVHVSDAMYTNCIENNIGSDVPHCVIESGFDIARFRDAVWPDDWRIIAGVSDEGEKPLVILIVSALEPRKRPIQIIEALTPTLRNHPDAVLVLAGEGPLYDDIKETARAQGVADQVKVLGYRDDPDKLIALSDICLLGSGQEGLPRSVLQYIVGGKPTVLFDLAGIDRVAKDGHNAIVISDDDWNGFADAVASLASDPEKRRMMSDAAKQIDLSAWDWTEMGSRTVQFYQEVMNKTQLTQKQEPYPDHGH